MSQLGTTSQEEVCEPHSPIECRVYERYPSGLPTSCQPVAARGAGDSKWSATVQDVSLGGIGLIINRRFERGVGLAIELPEATFDSYYTAFARVVHIKAQAGGLWLHGCAFVGQLKEDGLATLMRSVPQGPASPAPSLRTVRQEHQTPPQDKATSGPRLIGGVHLKCQFRGGREINRFIKRLKVAGPWPFARGSIIRGWVGRGAAAKLPVRMKVSRCVQEGESWTLTCKFVDAPTAEVLRFLLGESGAISPGAQVASTPFSGD